MWKWHEWSSLEIGAVRCALGHKHSLASENQPFNALTQHQRQPENTRADELFRTALRPKISTKASKTESTLPRLEQPALNGPGLQVDRSQSGLGERQGDSRGRRTSCLNRS
jgi:hypothetical protein